MYVYYTYLCVTSNKICLHLCFTTENIHHRLLSLINPAVYLLNKILVGGVIVATAPELCQKVFFFLKKRMKDIVLMFWKLCLLSINCNTWHYINIGVGINIHLVIFGRMANSTTQKNN